MRHWPTLVCALMVVTGCAGSAPPAQAPAPVETAPAVATPAPTPTPAATPTPAPTPSATPTPKPSATPEQLTEVPEGQHGPDPFPSPPAQGAIDLKGKTVLAGAGNATALGAVDGKPYTAWSARQGVAENVWWQVDLGSQQSVSRVDVLPDASPEAPVFFEIETSADGETWTKAAAGRAFASNQRPRWGSGLLPTGTKTRYVRFVPTSWPRSWVALWEVRVYP